MDSEMKRLVDRIAEFDRKLNEALLGIDSLRRRMTAYVGDGVALTHLFDDTPIYVNSHDFGAPSNFMNGGLYEMENLDVLLSFVRDDTVFLDIGANLGYFSLMVGRRVRPHGRVHAFEPNPEIMGLLRASAYLNGFGNLDRPEGFIISHPIAAGDENRTAEFGMPDNHAGGGVQLIEGSSFAGRRFFSEMRRLDDYFDPAFTCDLVKIDVEGGELAALRGMREILKRSKSVKVLFEKLGVNVGSEGALETLFAELRFRLYAVEGDARLRLLAPDGLRTYSGYVLAAPDDLDLNLKSRTAFDIYPRQFNTVAATLVSLGRERLKATGSQGQILFHGPYWFLRGGVYEFTVEASMEGELIFALASRFGHKQHEVKITDKTFTLVVKRDMLYFECIGVVSSSTASISLQAVRIRRVG